MLGRQFVAAVGPDQQHPPPAEVVRQEGDQIQGGAVRPVEILQYQEDGFGGRDRIQQPKQLLEQPELRSRRIAVGSWALLAHDHLGQEPAQLMSRPQQLADVLAGRQRADGLGDRKVGHLGTDQVDAPPDQRLRSRGACPSAELRHQPRLADARVAGQQDRPALSCRRLPHPFLEPLELAETADEGGGRPGCHRTSMAPPSRTREAAE
jgi:hypothetical protein